MISEIPAKGFRATAHTPGSAGNRSLSCPSRGRRCIQSVDTRRINPDQRHLPSTTAIATVRKKARRVTGGAEIPAEHALHADGGEAPAGDGDQIELPAAACIGAEKLPPATGSTAREGIAHLGADFISSSADRRPDPGHERGRRRPTMDPAPYGCFEHTSSEPTPARMGSGNARTRSVAEEHRQAIRRHDHAGLAGTVSDDGVGAHAGHRRGGMGDRDTVHLSQPEWIARQMQRLPEVTAIASTAAGSSPTWSPRLSDA